MLELFGSGLISLWLDMAGVHVNTLDALDVLSWQSSPGLVIAPDPNPAWATTVDQYLKGLQAAKLSPADQGVWIQSGPVLMANNQGNVPLPAASLSKIATTLAALKTWGPSHQFQTLVSATGPVQNGILQGDLIIQGGNDPFFIWEEAIALANSLNQLGIKHVTGNIIVTGNFAMNYQLDPKLAGDMFKQALNSATWPREAAIQYTFMPKGTPKPQLTVAGKVQVVGQGFSPMPRIPAPNLAPNPGVSIPGGMDKAQASAPSASGRLLIRHLSLPLARIVKEMNIYSNNEIAEMLAQSVGGAEAVRSIASTEARVPLSEVQLVNGSGLGLQNRISPRAVCAMFMAIQRYAGSYQMNVADLFPVVGVDHRGTTYARHIPTASVVKTGTLNDVSSLAGVMPTRDRGLVWFAILNRGNNVSGFRTEQDKLLQALSLQLQVAPAPASITTRPILNPYADVGAANRNEVVKS